MADQDIEQYRSGFEAWARSNGADLRREGDGYYWIFENELWKAWTAAKREASTEPSAWMCVGSVEPEFTADALLAGYWMRKGRTVTPLYAGGGAQKDEAKDAARYRYLRHAQWFKEGFAKTEPNASSFQYGGKLLDEKVDAAIAAQARAGKA